MNDGKGPRGGRSVLVLTVAALTGAVCGLAGAAVQASAAPPPSRTAADAADDAFFTPPNPLPPGAPGDVIRARPAKAGPPGARALADAWEVMYLSTDAHGKPNAVTGMVLVPRKGDRAAAPIVGFGPGTHGPAYRCAPSRMIDDGAFYEQPAVNDMLARGWAVAVTDYEGYHPDPETTYVVGRSTGPALIDAVRAAQRLPEAGLSADAKVAFRGYSQGGGAAMWAGELQPSYAPGLNLVGVVGGGVPADLALVSLALNGGVGFGFLMNALIGLDNAYGLGLDGVLNENGRAVFGAMRKNDCAIELFADYQGRSVADYFTRSPLADAAWQRAYGVNKLGGSTITVPVFQYHVTRDELVDHQQAATLRSTYCSKGVKLTWKTFDAGHLTGVHLGNADALAFLTDRVAGKDAATNC
ncbi:lipase family protein [Actinocorallia populi]|uniref:lipase family protein n=1 Tax=Actinocorallia populi TaxID=2079200 RepID=UPI0018E4FD81|nr:lipase family protein [Actinocorallia populi]